MREVLGNRDEGKDECGYGNRDTIAQSISMAIVPDTKDFMVPT